MKSNKCPQFVVLVFDQLFANLGDENDGRQPNYEYI